MTSHARERVHGLGFTRRGPVPKTLGGQCGVRTALSVLRVCTYTHGHAHTHSHSHTFTLTCAYSHTLTPRLSRSHSHSLTHNVCTKDPNAKATPGSGVGRGVRFTLTWRLTPAGWPPPPCWLQAEWHMTRAGHLAAACLRGFPPCPVQLGDLFSEPTASQGPMARVPWAPTASPVRALAPMRGLPERFCRC